MHRRSSLIVILILIISAQFSLTAIKVSADPTAPHSTMDTVYMVISHHNNLWNGHSGEFVASVWVSLSQEINAGFLGFTWSDTANWRVDSAVYGPAVSSWEILGPIDTAIINSTARVHIGGAAIFNTTPAGSDQLWGSIYFSEKPGSVWSAGDEMVIDSAFVPPSGEFFIDPVSGPYFTPVFYRAHKVVFSDVIIEETAPALPTSFALSQNYPNPFNPTTKIKLSLPKSTDWELSVYNIRGQLVDFYSDHSGAGVVTIDWDGSEFSSGVYFYKVSAGELTATKKMVLLK